MGSVVAIPRLQTTSSTAVAHRLRWLYGMWDLPGSGIEPFPVLADGFLITEPPGRLSHLLKIIYCLHRVLVVACGT